MSILFYIIFFQPTQQNLTWIQNLFAASSRASGKLGQRLLSPSEDNTNVTWQAGITPGGINF